MQVCTHSVRSAAISPDCGSSAVPSCAERRLLPPHSVMTHAAVLSYLTNTCTVLTCCMFDADMRTCCSDDNITI
jgi:hypothetical protein